MKSLAYDTVCCIAVAVWGCAATLMIAAYLAVQEAERLLEMEP